MKILITNKSPHLLPAYATAGAAAMDVRAWLGEPVVLQPGKRALIPTGLYIALPQGYEGQIRSRSGLSVHHGVTVLNAPGTIDPDYRGELKVLLINLGENPYTVHDGERIAQLLVQPYSKVEWVATDDLGASTPRGAAGFGSTGRG